jgi:hypothetical protein
MHAACHIGIDFVHGEDAAHVERVDSAVDEKVLATHAPCVARHVVDGDVFAPIVQRFRFAVFLEIGERGAGHVR